MKQRRFDYKVKKGNQQRYSRPVKTTKQRQSGSSNKGLLIIVIVFIFFLLLSWYILSLINPPIKTPKNESNIPAVSHFLLINDNSHRRKDLHSVVLATLHRDSESIFLSYFPEKLSLNNQNTLNHYYQNDGSPGIVNQFTELIGNEPLFYCVLKKEFYSNISPDLAQISLWKENQNDLIVPQSLLKKDERDKYIFHLNGNDLLKYLQFDKVSRNLADVAAKDNRVLYVINQVIHKKRNIKRIVKAYHSDIVDHNFTIKEGSEYQYYFNSTDKLMVYNLPLRYKLVENRFELKLNRSRYRLAIKEVDEIKKKKLDLTARDYIRVARKVDPAVQSLIEVKIIDRSDRGNQCLSPSFLAYYRNFFRVDSCINERDYFVDESYIVNVKHKMELVNYARKALKIKKYYNSAEPLKEGYDLILVLGKDAPEFIQEGN